MTQNGCDSVCGGSGRQWRTEQQSLSLLRHAHATCLFSTPPSLCVRLCRPSFHASAFSSGELDNCFLQQHACVFCNSRLPMSAKHMGGHCPPQQSESAFAVVLQGISCEGGGRVFDRWIEDVRAPWEGKERKRKVQSMSSRESRGSGEQSTRRKQEGERNQAPPEGHIPRHGCG